GDGRSTVVTLPREPQPGDDQDEQEGPDLEATVGAEPLDQGIGTGIHNASPVGRPGRPGDFAGSTGAGRRGQGGRQAGVTRGGGGRVFMAAYDRREASGRKAGSRNG